MTTTPQLPEFASAAWYSDPSDHRSPHDGWLEALEISEPAQGERHEQRRTAITIRLLGAYHDGDIIFRYSGVRSYSVVSKACGGGVGDWLSDEFEISGDGLITHRISWNGFGPRGKSKWIIEAEEISYEWIPKKA
jgi:hypothetical protein